MKAYKISCEDDDHGAEIAFADRGRDLAGSRIDACDCGFVDRHVHRAPEFDKYAPGPVTVEQYLAEGWYWNCQNCERMCFADIAPIIIGDSVFCSRECCDRLFEKYNVLVQGKCHESIRKAWGEMMDWQVACRETQP